MARAAESLLTARRPSRHGERGQSLVETALSLPFLVLIVLGLADVGRVYYYAVAITSAAHEGAVHAARNPTATASDVARYVCYETGFAGVGAVVDVSCPSEIAVEHTVGSDSARVDVAYRMALLSGYLVGRVFAVNPVTIRASATFPLLR